MKMLLRLLLNILLRSQKDSDIALENLALRQQVAAMKWSIKRPRLRSQDRLFWILISRFWSNWREALVIVKPDNAVRWHKKGFKLFWKFKSQRKGSGRPPISPEIRDLILKMANANPLWGAPRIHGELHKLGIERSERTVSNLMPRRDANPPSQAWQTFLKNHMKNMISIDFFTVPTATFRILSSYFDYYHYDRTHYGLGKDTPFERPVQPRPAKGAKVIELPRVGGLHHRYEWKEAA